MVFQQNKETVANLSTFLEKSPSTIRSWIKAGKLEVERSGKRYLITDSKKNLDFIVGESRKHWGRPASAYTPKELSEYSNWHDVLDELAWLFKVSYSHDWAVKKKKFRLDIIFVRYLKAHKITLKRVKSIFTKNDSHTQKVIADDLKRGWYNELAYSVPLKPSTLGLSFSDININSDISKTRFAFPSWKVTTAYYAVYFYIRAMTLQKSKAFRLEEHGSTISSFKSTLLSPLSRVIWKFPLDIAYLPNQRCYRDKLFFKQIRHTQFQYSQHPRPPHRTVLDTFEHVYKTFQRNSKRSKRPSTYMIFDFLHDFRVWANYQNIDDLLSLRGIGYKAFIDQNLSLLLFVIGGITEICYVAVHGAESYLRNLQKLYDLFALNNPQLENAFVNTPLYQRCELYKDLGFIDKTINLKNEIDINTVVYLVDDEFERTHE